MKSIISLATFVVIGLALAACGGQVQAQTLASQVQITPSKTVDIANARYISITSGDQYVIDRNGVKHSGAVANVQAFTYATAFQGYAQYSGGVYLNLTATNTVDCSQVGTVITWANGATETLNDGCAFNDAVKTRSRK